jgi:hypothetical protein
MSRHVTTNSAYSKLNRHHHAKTPLDLEPCGILLG